MTLGDTQSYYAYTSDDGKVYNIKLYDIIGAQSELDDSTPGAHPAWGFKKADLRHVTGATTDGVHRSLLVCDADNAKWIACSGTWSAYGKTYTITGAFGEKRPASHKI